MRCDRSVSVAWLASLVVATSIVAPRATPLREQVSRLPFDHYHGLTFLTARINASEPLAFALDTGASLTTINESRAAALKLTLRDTRRVTGADGGEGSIRVAFANGVAIDVGNIRFAPDHVGVTSLAAAEQILGHPMDGVLGGDFISHYVVDIDYAGKTLTLSEPKAYRASRDDASSETLRLRMINGYPCVSARLKLPRRDALDLLLGIDTGDGGVLGLNSPVVTRHFRVNQVRRDSPAAAAGLLQGDVLLAIDDQPAAAFTLFQLRQIFKRDDGEVLLRVKRGEQELQYRFRMSRRI